MWMISLLVAHCHCWRPQRGKLRHLTPTSENHGGHSGATFAYAPNTFKVQSSFLKNQKRFSFLLPFAVLISKRNVRHQRPLQIHTKVYWQLRCPSDLVPSGINSYLEFSNKLVPSVLAHSHRLWNQSCESKSLQTRMECRGIGIRFGRKVTLKQLKCITVHQTINAALESINV